MPLEAGFVAAVADTRLDYVWFPHDAVISAVVTTPEGDTLEVGLLGFEGMTGQALLLGEDRSAMTMVVQIPGFASRMRAADFVREVVGRDGDTRRLLLRFTNAYLAVLAQVSACNADHSVEQRLARWLVMAHDRVGRDHFRLTHEFMAMMIGVRRASVTAVAGALRDAGAIAYVKGHVTILDRARLESRACACYQAIGDRIEAVFS